MAATATLAVAMTAYGIGSFYPPQLATMISPPIAPPPPLAGSDEANTLTQNIEAGLQSLPIVQSLRQREGWYETRPYSNIPEDRRVHNLTAGALRGPGRLAVPPILFARNDDTESKVIIHVGRSLCVSIRSFHHEVLDLTVLGIGP